MSYREVRVQRVISILMLTTILFSFAVTTNAAQGVATVIFNDVAWNPDSTYLAAAGVINREDETIVGGVLAVIDAATGEVIWKRQTETLGVGYSNLNWNSTGTQLSASRCSVIDVFSGHTGELMLSFTAHIGGCVTSFDWSDDGTRIISVSASLETPEMTLWDIEQLELITSIPMLDPWDVAFSPDQHWIAIGGSVGLFVLPVSLDIDIQTMEQYRLSDDYVASLTWNSAGTQIAYATHTFSPRNNSQIIVIDSVSGQVLWQQSTYAQTVYGLSWANTFDLLSSHSVDGSIHIWDASDGTQLETYSGNDRYNSIESSFSEYGGRFAIGGFLSEESFSAQSPAQTLILNGLNIVAPVASPERLQAIADLCDAPLMVESLLNTAIDAGDMSSVITQVESLPTGTIPPACAADLIAVAEAIQAQ